MNRKKVQGRGVNAGYFDARESEGEIVIRVDDEHNTAFWLELRLTRGDLLDMLAKLDAPEPPAADPVKEAEADGRDRINVLRFLHTITGRQ